MAKPNDPVQTQRDKITNQIRRSAETRDRQRGGAPGANRAAANDAGRAVTEGGEMTNPPESRLFEPKGAE